MGIGGLRVELNGFLGRGKRIEKSLVGGHGGEFAQQVVAVGQANVGVGIAGIARNGLSESVHSLIQALGSALVPVKTTFEVKLLRLAIGGEMQASGRNSNRLSSCLGVPVARAEHPHREKQHQQRRGVDQFPPGDRTRRRGSCLGKLGLLQGVLVGRVWI